MDAAGAPHDARGGRHSTRTLERDRGPWWVRPGSRHRGRPAADRRPRRRGARARARDAPVRLRPGPVRRERPRAPGCAGPDRAPVPRPLRAQGEPAPRGPRGLPRSGRARHPGERRHRRLLAGRGRTGHRLRLAPGRDQLHRDERLRARPRRPAGARDPRQPRCDQPGRALRPARARDGRSGCGSTRASAPATTSTSSTPATGRPSSGSGWSGSTMRSRPPPATTSRSTRSTSMPARAGWPTGLPGFERALAGRGRGGRAVARRRASRSARSTSAAGSGAPAREDERAVDLDAYAAVLARHLGPLGVTIACEPGDPLSKDAAILLGEVVTVERAARRHVRRARHRLERQLLVLHLPVRPGARRLPDGRRADGPRS